MLHRIRGTFSSGLALGVIPFLLLAQGSEQVPTPGVTQEILISAPLSQFPGKQITVFTGLFEPGAATPVHRHPGTEILYVLEGHGEMRIGGRSSEALREGGAILVEPSVGDNDFTHQAINGSESSEMRTLVLVIHDLDTPPALPITGQRTNRKEVVSATGFGLSRSP